MKCRVVFILLIFIPLSSCVTIRERLSVAENMPKVELNMTKQEVVRIMGESYDAVGSRNTREGQEEIIGYLDANGDIYLLTFLNGRLIEYHKRWLSRYDHDRDHDHRPVGSVGDSQKSHSSD